MQNQSFNGHEDHLSFTNCVTWISIPLVFGENFVGDLNPENS